jgi:hypothetical protein
MIGVDPEASRDANPSGLRLFYIVGNRTGSSQLRCYLGVMCRSFLEISLPPSIRSSQLKSVSKG